MELEQKFVFSYYPPYFLSHLTFNTISKKKKKQRGFFNFLIFLPECHFYCPLAIEVALLNKWTESYGFITKGPLPKTSSRLSADGSALVNVLYSEYFSLFFKCSFFERVSLNV